jgi:hypothetical protein
MILATQVTNARAAMPGRSTTTNHQIGHSHQDSVFGSIADGGVGFVLFWVYG